MLKALISVIVPVYKVEEKWLRKSIESIIGQTYQNIEIIIVDDGSPDNCGEICEEYASKDIRIHVFHTDNNGVSAARNYALDRANGDYIFFLDSDDSIREDTLEYIYRKTNLNNRDKKIIDKMLTSALKRLIREPIINLKQTKDKGKREEYIKLVEELFEL